MESNKKLTGNQSTATGAGQSRTPTGSTADPMGSTTSPSTSTSGYTTGSAPQRAREEGSGVAQSTVQAVTSAYDKTSQALTSTYDQAMTFGKEHPGQLTLIAFGAGIGVGLLLASLGGGRSRTSRIAEPVVNAISQVAMEFFR